jgi:hypothetical protein
VVELKASLSNRGCFFAYMPPAANGIIGKLSIRLRDSFTVQGLLQNFLTKSSQDSQICLNYANLCWNFIRLFLKNIDEYLHDEK